MAEICKGSNIFQKDPDAELDYKFDWKAKTNGSGYSDWLQSGESLSFFILVASDPSITISNAALTDNNTSVTFWLTGGTEGSIYDIVCSITTDSVPVNRRDDRTMVIEIVQK